MQFSNHLAGSVRQLRIEQVGGEIGYGAPDVARDELDDFNGLRGEAPDFEMVELPCDQESAKRYLKLQ